MVYIRSSKGHKVTQGQIMVYCKIRGGGGRVALEAFEKLPIG